MSLEHAFFYDSNNGDRKYNAESFEYWLKKFFTTGVFNGDLKVLANGDMSITVSGGYCNVGGKVRFFEEDTVLGIDTAGATQDRIDSIVIERNDIERDITLKVVNGEYSDSPVARSLVRSDGVYQLAIAQIRISAGTVKITQSDVKDTRTSTELCGLVTGTVEEMDFSQLKAQWDSVCEECEEDFEEWFDEMKDQLNADAAGNLQNQIAVERARIDSIVALEEGSTTGDAELQDIRIGIDGYTYATAGEAVRKQLTNAVGRSSKITDDLYYSEDICWQDTNMNCAIKISEIQIGGADITDMIYTYPGAGLITRDVADYYVWYGKVMKGSSLVLADNYYLYADSQTYNLELVIADSSGMATKKVEFEDVNLSGFYEMEEDGYIYICAMCEDADLETKLFSIKTPKNRPLVLDESLAGIYDTDTVYGDEALNAILDGRQILVKTPNADGGNYTAIYSPIYMYQLPNYKNNYLYLFYLKDEKQTLDLSAVGAGTYEMPVYGQLKMLLSTTYNEDPLG